MRGEQRRDAVVGVLVDDDEPERAMRLRLERVEQRLEGLRAVDRRDDEVEAEISSRFRHRRRLPSAGRGHPARFGPPRRPRRGDDRRGGRRGRARSDERRSRAPRGRRRIGRPYGGRARRGRRREASRDSKSRAARACGRAQRRSGRGARVVRGADGRRRRRVARLAGADFSAASARLRPPQWSVLPG